MPEPPLSIDAYVVLKAAGIAWFFLAGLWSLRRQMLSVPLRALYLLLIIVCGFIGSKFWFFVQHFFGREPYPYMDFNAAWADAGSVLYGWILGGSLAAWLGARALQLPALEIFDRLLPHFLVAQILNRLGCFAAGCCWGSGPCDLPWAVASEMAPGMKIHPVQLYEAAWDSLLLLFMSFPLAGVGMKARALRVAKMGHGNSEKSSKNPGKVTIMYFIGYPLGRFFLEFIRGDNKVVFGGLTVPQITSLIIIFVLLISRANLIKKTVA